MPYEMVVGKIEFAPNVTGSKSPTDWYAQWKHQADMNTNLVEENEKLRIECRKTALDALEN